MREENIAGKPAPDSFLRAAQLLDVRPRIRRRCSRTRSSGVAAGRAGNFGVVVGVDRVGQAEELRRNGADVVVTDLAELLDSAMIADDAFPVEPWQVRETTLDLDLLAQSESLFALSNGHIGLRGNLDEGEPHGLPGTYLNGFYETRPLPYAEVGLLAIPRTASPSSTSPTARSCDCWSTTSRSTSGTANCFEHERVLDLRAGTLARAAQWRSPAGKQVRVQSTRLVSLAQRSVAAIEYVVEAIDEFVRVTVQSELVANEDQPERSDDPRVAAVLRNPLEPVRHETTDNGALLVHRTRAAVA